MAASALMSDDKYNPSLQVSACLSSTLELWGEMSWQFVEIKRFCVKGRWDASEDLRLVWTRAHERDLGGCERQKS